MKSLSINGTNLSTFGIYLSSDTYLNSPQIDYSEYQVPARNGNVILDNKRLGNVVRKFSCYIKDDPESGIVSLKKLAKLDKCYYYIECYTLNFIPNLYSLIPNYYVVKSEFTSSDLPHTY